MSTSFTPSSANISQTGTTPIGTIDQSQPALGGGQQTVKLQQMVIVDAAGTGTNAIPAVVDGNGLHVVLQQGTPQNSGQLEQAIAAAANFTFQTKPITTGKIAILQHALVAATFSASWLIQTVDNGSASTPIATILTQAGQSFDLRVVMNNEIATVLQTGSNTLFSVLCVNIDSVSGTAYTTLFWAEN